MSQDLVVGDHSITVEDVVAVARNRKKVSLSQEAINNVKQSRASVERILDTGAPVYGVNTGFGRLASVAIEKDQCGLLQKNLIMSHAAGTGENLPSEIVRGAMFLRVVSLSKGYSGIRPETLELLIELLNRDITPVVPCQGSVGSSGDLAPLAHIALGLIGVGDCIKDGRQQPVAMALNLAGLKPVDLEAKEGLALINGTQVMTSIMAFNLDKSRRLAKIADIAGAMTLDAVHGMPNAFYSRLHRIRPHKGQGQSAANILSLVEESQLVGSVPERIQDAYSIRCMPVVHGASRDTIDYVGSVIDTEMNSVTDNPSIFSDNDEVVSAGNFHGQPVALVSDFLGIAIAELGNISERRTNRLVDGSYNHLPAFLVKKPGVNSGLMIPQYTAAALVSENKGLAFPNSVDSITTSANQEDHNSMGTIASRNAKTIINNVETVLSVELMNACQALEFTVDRKPGKGVSIARDAIREILPAWEEDRPMPPAMDGIKKFTAESDVIDRIEETCGKLF